MSESLPPPARHLRDDRSGAIMVIGVFMAILLCGLLFYIAGVGQLVFRRERMQDAADAVALAAAVGHARGMNLIVFINLVMAALVAIVLALKLIELMLTALTFILAAISWLIPPAAAAIPVVNEFRAIMTQVHDAARDVVDNVLTGLHFVEEAVRVLTPTQATVMSMLKAEEKYGPMVDFTVAVPPRLTLPLEDDDYNELCDRAGIMLESLITALTDGVPFVGKVMDVIAGLAVSVTKAFCYKTADPPKVAPTQITRNLWQSPTGFACEQDKENMQVPSDNCTAWERELLLRHPESDGNCPRDPNGPDPNHGELNLLTGNPVTTVTRSSSGGGGNDERRQLCEDAIAGARVECLPARRSRAFDYSWSQQMVKEHVVFDVNSWSWLTTSFTYQGEPDFKNTSTYSQAQAEFDVAQGNAVNVDPAHPNASREPFRQAESDSDRQTERGKPCDNGYRQYEPGYPADDLWSGWNSQVYWEEFPGVTKPVCTQRLAEYLKLPNGGVVPENIYGGELPPGYAEEGYTLEYLTVKNVYGCSEKDTIQLKFPEEWSQGETSDSGDDKVPLKMEEGVKLGDSNFQIRGVAMNWDGWRPERVRKGLHDGAFGRAMEPEFWVTPAGYLGRVAVAQAEYFYDHGGQEESDEWMWHMNWRARLVRFRVSSDDEGEQEQQDQQFSGSDMEIASLGTTEGSGRDVSTDLSSVPLPEGFPSLDSVEDIIVH